MYKFRNWMHFVLAATCLPTGIVVGQSTGQPSQNQNPGTRVSVTAKDAPTTPDPAMPIGPGDLVDIAVFDLPELTQEVRISNSGDAEITLLGTMHLAGQTVKQAKAQIEQNLKDRNFVKNPDVQITIKEYFTQGVSVLGQVAHPGVYPVLGPRNLMDLISAAGGLTPMASTEAAIKRRSGQEETIAVGLSNDAKEMFSNQVNLEPGDTVFIPRAGIVYILGDVGRPGGFLMQNNGRISLLQAVAMAAGVNRDAAATKARIIRKTDAGLKEANINLKRIMKGQEGDIELQAEDIVYVPLSTAKGILLRAPDLTQAAASAAVYQGVQALP